MRGDKQKKLLARALHPFWSRLWMWHGAYVLVPTFYRGPHVVEVVIGSAGLGVLLMSLVVVKPHLLVRDKEAWNALGVRGHLSILGFQSLVSALSAVLMGLGVVMALGVSGG